MLGILLLISYCCEEVMYLIAAKAIRETDSGNKALVNKSVKPSNFTSSIYKDNMIEIERHYLSSTH